MSADQIARAGAVPRTGRTGFGVVAAAASLAVTAVIIGISIGSVASRSTALWVLGRATGVAAYLLLLTVVLSGLVLSHPWRSQVTRPAVGTRIRTHIVVTIVALALLVAHIALLASDRYAGVGLDGAIVPFRSTYRPVSVGLGVLAGWLVVFIGATAALAGRLPARVWWPLHKIAISSLVLCWVHAVFAGSDAAGLRWFYLATAVLVGAVALSRYVARSPADRRREPRP